MKSFFNSVAFVLVALAPLLSVEAPPILGQEGAGASVHGRVLGPSGAPTPGVTVFLRAGGRDLAARAVSDENGEFHFGGLTVPAPYQVMVSIGGLTEAGPLAELTNLGEIAEVEVRLKLAIAQEISVTADAWTLPVEPPNSISSRTFDQIRTQNLFNPEDALKTIPSTAVRKRYIGDRNALVSGRSFGSLQPSRALVYLDGYLLSNFLGRFDAPRWNMLTPEALERVDVLYGPFSAVHPGNSIGTTVVMTERTPTKLDWGVRVTGSGQRFSQYDTRNGYASGQASGYLGGRIQSGLWGTLAFNHEDATSQPMQWFGVSANPAGSFPSVSGASTRVSGILYDTDPLGNRRAIFGPNSGAIDHTKQDTAKLRAGKTFAAIDVSGLAAFWHDDSVNRNQTYLKDATGNPVWEGTVTDGINTFFIPSSTFGPARVTETHGQFGFTAKTRRVAGWNGSVIVSDYRIFRDANRIALNPDPVAASGGAGTVTRRGGTGWDTIEAQATRSPSGGPHALTFGVHRNMYRLKNIVNDAGDWRSTETALNQSYTGRTSIQAFYAQDAIALTETLKLTLGWRAEWFNAFNGNQTVHVSTCTGGSGSVCLPDSSGAFYKTLAYAGRNLSGQSPKASLSWTLGSRLIIRTSIGRGVRFPNVEELYNGTVTAASVTLSDPGLKAERSTAVEVSAERFWTHHVLRSTFFMDDVRDAILRQTNVLVTPNITNISNVDHARTPGLEFVWMADGLPVKRMNLEANLTLADSKVVKNSHDPLSEGKYWLRVPKTRGNVVVSFRPSERWLTSIAYRHQGRSYNDVYNLDINPNVYGGVSSINQIDLRSSYRVRKGVEVAVGLDNLANSHAFVFHPFPGRTAFSELRVSSR